jgi:transcription-repair coupling factor (superfamily II helicase)
VAPTPTDKLLDAFARLPVTKNLVAQLKLGARCKAGGLWGASAGLLLAILQRAHPGQLLVLTADDVDSLLLQTDLNAFGVTSHVLVREETGDDGEPDPLTRSERQKALQHVATDHTPLLCGIEAMLQPVATPKGLRKARLELTTGQKLDRTQVLQRAHTAGLRSVPLVLAPGECSVRGDVVDVFPMAADQALRLEFFDDTLESIRSFDAATQRTTVVHERFALALAESDATEVGPVLKHLTPSQTLVVTFEPLRVEERTARLLTFDADVQKRESLATVTVNSQPEVKVSLFQNLFRGRTTYTRSGGKERTARRAIPQRVTRNRTRPRPQGWNNFPVHSTVLLLIL